MVVGTDVGAGIGADGDIVETSVGNGVGDDVRLAVGSVER